MKLSCVCMPSAVRVPPASGRGAGLSRAVALECVVVWSSVGSGLGNVGQASYACANAWLDAHARSRRVGGAMASSGQWPLVGGAGMGAAAHAAAAARRAGGAGRAGISLEEYAAWLGVQHRAPCRRRHAADDTRLRRGAVRPLHTPSRRASSEW